MAVTVQALRVAGCLLMGVMVASAQDPGGRASGVHIEFRVDPLLAAPEGEGFDESGLVERILKEALRDS